MSFKRKQQIWLADTRQPCRRTQSKQKRNKRSTRSANFPTSSRNETKTSEFVPNLPHQKRSFLFGPGEQILDQIETIYSQQDKFENYTKTFWFRFQNNFGMFVLLFLTLLSKTFSLKCRWQYSKTFLGGPLLNFLFVIYFRAPILHFTRRWCVQAVQCNQCYVC